MQATAEGERWAVWDVADDPESSACRLDQLAGECGDNAPCQVRPKDSVAQRAEVALRAKHLGEVDPQPGSLP